MLRVLIYFEFKKIEMYPSNLRDVKNLWIHISVGISSFVSVSPSVIPSIFVFMVMSPSIFPSVIVFNIVSYFVPYGDSVSYPLFPAA